MATWVQDEVASGFAEIMWRTALGELEKKQAIALLMQRPFNVRIEAKAQRVVEKFLPRGSSLRS